MADFDDDVDFKKIAQEVSFALAKDEKYQRENDAKFRAINQKVKNYEEFRDIVDASHLKPLDKTDKIGGMSYQKWNHLASVETTPSKPKQATETKSSIPISQPANPYDFSRTWKKICTTSSEKYEFLLSIKLDMLKKCLESDCMLGDIISVLEASLSICNEKASQLLNILEVIATTKRFSLALDFLSVTEISKLKNVFTYLQQVSDGDPHYSARLTTLSFVYKVS